MPTNVLNPGEAYTTGPGGTDLPGVLETSILGGVNGLPVRGNDAFLVTVRNPVASGGNITSLRVFKSPNDPADLTEDTIAPSGLTPVAPGSVVWFVIENEPLGLLKVTADAAGPVSGVVVSVRGRRALR